jgi:hypothetical protein
MHHETLDMSPKQILSSAYSGLGQGSVEITRHSRFCSTAARQEVPTSATIANSTLFQMNAEISKGEGVLGLWMLVYEKIVKNCR